MIRHCSYYYRPHGGGYALVDRSSRKNSKKKKKREEGKKKKKNRARVAVEVYPSVCLNMVKLSAELIEQAAQYTNPVRDRELDLRG